MVFAGARRIAVAKAPKLVKVASVPPHLHVPLAIKAVPVLTEASAAAKAIPHRIVVPHAPKPIVKSFPSVKIVSLYGGAVPFSHLHAVREADKTTQ